MANRPVQEIRLGRVKAAIWENETEKGSGPTATVTRHNVTVARLYKDGDDWKTTDSFGRDDLPLLAKVVDLAHTWIFTKTQDGITQSVPDGKEHRGGSKRSR